MNYMRFLILEKTKEIKTAYINKEFMGKVIIKYHNKMTLPSINNQKIYIIHFFLNYYLLLGKSGIFNERYGNLI